MENCSVRLVKLSQKTLSKHQCDQDQGAQRSPRLSTKVSEKTMLNSFSPPTAATRKRKSAFSVCDQMMMESNPNPKPTKRLKSLITCAYCCKKISANLIYIHLVSCKKLHAYTEMKQCSKCHKKDTTLEIALHEATDCNSKSKPRDFQCPKCKIPIYGTKQKLKGHMTKCYREILEPFKASSIAETNGESIVDLGVPIDKAKLIKREPVHATEKENVETPVQNMQEEASGVVPDDNLNPILDNDNAGGQDPAHYEAPVINSNDWQDWQDTDEDHQQEDPSQDSEMQSEPEVSDIASLQSVQSLQELVSTNPEEDSRRKCPFCGIKFEDILNTHPLWCPSMKFDEPMQKCRHCQESFPFTINVLHEIVCDCQTNPITKEGAVKCK